MLVLPGRYGIQKRMTTLRAYGRCVKDEVSGGRLLPVAEAQARWAAWTPAQLMPHMANALVPWYVAGGWALDLFLGTKSREHDDLEIAVPAGEFGKVIKAFPGYSWDVVGEGRVWPYPEQAAEVHQTWLRDPATGRYVLDVFREPHVSDVWVCRREKSITLPLVELIMRTDDGIPFGIPEVILLFKAKYRRDKDEADFRRILPSLTAERKARLSQWLGMVHPNHAWMDLLAAGR